MTAWTAPFSIYPAHGEESGIMVPAAEGDAGGSSVIIWAAAVHVGSTVLIERARAKAEEVHTPQARLLRYGYSKSAGGCSRFATSTVGTIRPV